MNSSHEAITDTSKSPEEKENVGDYGIPGKWIITRRKPRKQKKMRKKFLDSFR